MPNIKSAKKRVLVNTKKTEINKSEKSAVKTAIKAMNAVIATGNYEEAVKLLPKTFSILDKAILRIQSPKQVYFFLLCASSPNKSSIQ